MIDEQHKFGVRQRATLKSGKAEPKGTVPFSSNENRDSPQASPHYLVMTATPIPRA